MQGQLDLFGDCNLLQPLNSDCVQTACGSALPAGNYNSNNKKFNNLGNNANFWSSTADGGEAYRLNLYGNVSKPNIEGCSVDNGFSVRCLRDSN